jgi:hypothetical protein
MTPQPPTAALSSNREQGLSDDAVTICAISIVAGILTNLLHEGLGHGLTALLTGTRTGVLSTVAWSSAHDTRLVAAGGTLVNLAAGLTLWMALRTAKSASAHVRYFLLISCAFNLFAGTGYFLFSGATDFGDWAVVINGMQPHGLWRALLVVLGATTYFISALVVGVGFVRYMGVPRDQHSRLWKLSLVPYLSAVVLSGLAGLMNPVGIQLLWQSALPSSAGADSGLLWLQYYIPKRIVPKRTQEAIDQSYIWTTIAAIFALVFILVLGRGIILSR